MILEDTSHKTDELEDQKRTEVSILENLTDFIDLTRVASNLQPNSKCR